MKSLLILRHAKSSWKHPELTDHDRPLNKRGKRDAPRMGEILRSEHLIPEAIISSMALFMQLDLKHILKSCMAYPMTVSEFWWLAITQAWKNY